MLTGNVFRLAFLISFSGHCLFLGVPVFKGIPPAREEKRNEIKVTFEAEKPALLPKIDTLGQEKKLKEIKEENRRQFKQRSSTAAPAEQSVPKEAVKAANPAQEAMLRYQDMVKQRIEEARRYPLWAKKQGIEGVTRLYFSVLSGGSSGDITIIRSSGSSVLDEEAVATVKRAGPFPPIPVDIKSPSVGMEVAIVFSLNKEEDR